MAAQAQADREFDWSTGRELERKDAEIERLRAALEAIVAKDRIGFGRGALGHIARQALKAQERS